jgi:hypothetical protein
MATLLEIYNLRVNTELKNRTSSAVAKAVTDVLNENPATQNHTQRIAWANKAMKDIDTWTAQFMWDVTSDTTIQAAGANCTDTDIMNVVNGSIDKYALNP